jgi:hypothetical protein
MNIRKFIIILLSTWLCFCLLAKQAEASFAIEGDLTSQTAPHQIESDGDDTLQADCFLLHFSVFSLPLTELSKGTVAESLYISQVVPPPLPPPVL